jgi:hypothetical protein
MGKIFEVARPPDLQRRKYRRFPLRYPVLVEFSSGATACEVPTVSWNVSLGGLLLESPSDLPKSQLLRFTLTVEGGSVVRPLRFCGEGKVVRVEPRSFGAGFAVAVECTVPMFQIEDYLVGSSD